MVTTLSKFFFPVYFSVYLLLYFPTDFLNPSQNEFEVQGAVVSKRLKLTGAVIKVYRDTTLIKKIITKSNGKFKFEIPFDNEYMLIISKPGFIVKKFAIDLRSVPFEKIRAGLGAMYIEASIFELPADSIACAEAYSILNDPVAKFSFNEAIGEITFDRAYIDSRMNDLQKLTAIEKESAGSKVSEIEK
ncbi:MAG: hypothetical protein K0Q95_1702 [Bacteroidota bacterium]|jgi:hypothetical protein|nr:hypothetical protein [Bacteroidota bacterium]